MLSKFHGHFEASERCSQLKILLWRDCSQLSTHHFISFSAPFSPAGSETAVKFDSQGDGVGRYNIFSYQRSGERYAYVPVGEWAESLSLNGGLIQWPREAAPTSQCSDPCERNEMKKMQAGGSAVLCIFTTHYQSESRSNPIASFFFWFCFVCSFCLRHRRVLLLDLYCMRASRISGWRVHLLTLRSGSVAHRRPDVLLRAPWGLHHVGRRVGHRAHFHRLCGVSDDCHASCLRSLWVKQIQAPENDLGASLGDDGGTLLNVCLSGK